MTNSSEIKSFHPEYCITHQGCNEDGEPEYDLSYIYQEGVHVNLLRDCSYEDCKNYAEQHAETQGHPLHFT